MPRQVRTSHKAQALDWNAQLQNPIKTVSDTLSTFYKEYPQPPVLPLYRPMIIDLLTQVHLAMADSRFIYDAVFALGLRENFFGIMNSYDKFAAPDETQKIWKAFLGAVGLDADKVNADAEAVATYAKENSQQQILKQIEGMAIADETLANAFSSCAKSLWTLNRSIGLFKMMEFSGSELTNANVEQWSKLLKAPVSCARDLKTFKTNRMKLQKAEELLREIEIREKKQLAERLEAKAKALAEKKVKVLTPA